MSESSYEYWREYPERDPQAVVWYPCTYSPISPVDIWGNEPADARSGSVRKIGFYIHVPLCKGICKYCPFNKYTWTPKRAELYLAALKEEIRLVTAQPYFEKTEVVAGFFGGGTPTSLNTQQLADLLEFCNKHFNIASDAEISIEATPNTIDEEKLRTIRGLGVNRLSIGVQSFNPRLLRIMGRAHRDAQYSIRAVELAHKVGFDVVSIDLLYRVPGQTLSDWRNDLSQAVGLGLDHLTTFSLFLDPGTPLYDAMTVGNTLPQPDEETDLKMYQLAVNMLGEAGFNLYTLYDFAQSGKECIHHAVSWQAPQLDYPGFGPGAFSFINNGKESHIYCNISPLDEYLASVNEGRQPVDFGKKLSHEEEMSRYMVLGVNFLRVIRAPFRERFGVDFTEVYKDKLQQLDEWGLIRIDEKEMILTEKGKIFLANVSKMFFTDENRGMPHVIGVELQKGDGLSLVGLNKGDA